MERDYMHDRTAMERDALLVEILRPLDRDQTKRQRDILEARLGRLANYASRGQAELGIEQVIGQPVFVELSSDMPTPDLLAMARQELVGRQFQSNCFRRLKRQVVQAETPTDMVVLTDIYGFLCIHARVIDQYRPEGYGNLFEVMLRHIAMQQTNSIGQLDADQLTEFMLPAVQRFIENESMGQIYGSLQTYLRQALPKRFVKGSIMHKATKQIIETIEY